MAETFFITTPIYYVNDKPHIGHLCTTLAADILARHYRSKLGNDKVFFLTGVDEHGAKIAEAAAAAGLDPQTYCDQLSQEFKLNWDNLSLSYDYFIRTTDPRHEKVVSDFLQKLYDQGDIYKAKYEGWYCVGCEKFLAESDLVEGKCPLHPTKDPVWQSEENYFFKLSKYAPLVREAITDPNNLHHYKIYPEDKRVEIVNKIDQGVRDISISRAEVSWGIPIPWDKSQTIYVWFDALINYYSATQFVPDKQQYWPANLHTLAKDITWFHNVIWEAMLLAANLPLPKATLVHSYYISGGQKMSKSIGNVITPNDLIEKFALDGTRYLILTTFPYPRDSDITFAYLTEKYNADLANGLGNLVQRTAKLCEKNKVTIEGNTDDQGKSEAVRTFTENFEFAFALEEIWKIVREANQYINDKEPWKLSEKEAQQVLEKVAWDLRKVAVNLQPFLPATAKKIESIFTGSVITPEKPLFPRV